MDDKQNAALEFIQNLDTKHDQLLTDLDVLNARIEQVLEGYAKSRGLSPNLASPLEAPDVNEA